MTGRCVKCEKEIQLGSDICDQCAWKVDRRLGVFVMLILFSPVILGVLLIILSVLNNL